MSIHEKIADARLFQEFVVAGLIAALGQPDAPGSTAEQFFILRRGPVFDARAVIWK